MTIREKIVSKVHKLPDRALAEVYEFVNKMERQADEPSLMERLRQIKINGPRDFSTNIDLYLSGEKKVSENID
ncbi:hypothetical protein BH20ACI2_BH20ACI2_13300 [soil metagenome]